DLLSEPQQRVLARISVFPAAFTLAAAEDVASGEGLAGQDIGVLLAGLVDSSTVELTEDADGQTHYRTLETTRRYSRGLLSDSDVEARRRRHAQHYLGLADTARPHLFRPDSGPWL